MVISSLGHMTISNAARIDLLPCKIGYTGPADVDKYFNPERICEDGRDIYVSSFRGRKLKGFEASLPVGTAGTGWAPNDRNTW